MKQLLELLKDGNTRTIQELSLELGMSAESLRREMEYLEHMHIISRVPFSAPAHGNCANCPSGGSAACKGCIPEGGFKNTGEVWEVIR